MTQLPPKSDEPPSAKTLAASMAHGDLKTGQKGTNSIFVMSHAEILNMTQNQTITYARVIVDFCPQKADPHRI
jgi:hypothetical protein